MDKQKKVTIGAMISAYFFVIIAVVLRIEIAKNSNPHQYDAFAQCLSKMHAVMYGASWCPHCQAQKSEFGDSFQFVTYVECVKNPTLCAEKEIDAYPTWLIGTSSKVEGFDDNTMKMLSIATGCVLPN